MLFVFYFATSLWLFHGVNAYCFNSGSLDIQCDSLGSKSELLLKFGKDGSSVKCGQEAGVPQYRSAPVIQFPYADKKKIYTVIMVDPDAPSPDNPTMKYFLHWIVVDIPGKYLRKGCNLEKDGKHGHILTLLTYVAPRPPFGRHRYQFFLAEQEPYQIFQRPARRPKFDLESFLQNHKLCRIVATTDVAFCSIDKIHVNNIDINTLILKNNSGVDSCLSQHYDQDCDKTALQLCFLHNFLVLEEYGKIPPHKHKKRYLQVKMNETEVKPLEETLVKVTVSGTEHEMTDNEEESLEMTNESGIGSDYNQEENQDKEKLEAVINNALDGLNREGLKVKVGDIPKISLKSYICIECGKEFKKKSRLDRHMITHSSDKPYVCEECGKAFSYKDSLKKHMLLHTGSMPIECPICQKQFPVQSKLTSHMWSHSEEKRPKRHVKSHLNVLYVTKTSC
ncbi:hypothetical protein KUTeg_002161 [Tegillarca granosa]|uniref:C2H2-type domain-containing protein n=1 Tax=Tegillarca granosa TaxID=220873 RepID=A0ABQ9FTJ3_TEGGR|nr:hypothetical protein KUTeg_002161 [Tegillarca granosa]